GIDVWTLLAVDLDGDVALVQHRRDLLVVERLLLHHVAPVARRVADAEENRLALRAGLRERLVRPRVPVDGIVRVLAEVGAGLGRETVRLAGGPVGIPMPRR